MGCFSPFKSAPDCFLQSSSSKRPVSRCILHLYSYLCLYLYWYLFAFVFYQPQTVPLKKTSLNVRVPCICICFVFLYLWLDLYLHLQLYWNQPQTAPLKQTSLNVGVPNWPSKLCPDWFIKPSLALSPWLKLDEINCSNAFKFFHFWVLDSSFFCWAGSTHWL